MLGKRFRLSSISFLSIISLLNSGCMVGPNFQSPAAPKVAAYNAKPLPAHTVSTAGIGKSGVAQKFMTAQDIPAEWWHLFRSNELNNLINSGLANSPTLEASYAALRVSQETLNAQIGNSLLPAFDLTGLAERQRTSGATSSSSNSTAQIFNLYNASVNVSYTLDIFGGQRRQIEALRAQVDYQQFELIAAYITLTANIVTTSVTSASLQGQIVATKELIQAEDKQLTILRKQFALGGIANDIVLTQETLVNQTRATLPPLEKSLAQSQHALTTLIGHFPNEPLPKLDLSAINLPVEIPVSLPSNLVRQRPDVRAAEALLHAANAKVGVATANLFPQLTISGNQGWQSSIASTLFSSTNKVWALTGNLAQPLFHGGALLADRRGAQAAYDQAFANYKQIVLQAFQNVADTLRALDTDAQSLRAQRRAEVSAQANVKLATRQYALGGSSYLALLNAEQQYQTVKIARIQAQATRYSDTAALFQALGGGWWNKPWCIKECL